MDELTKQFSFAYHVSAYIVVGVKYTVIALENIGPGYARMWLYDVRSIYG